MAQPGSDVLELPKFVWIIKIVQAVLSVVLLGLAAYQISVVSWSGDGLMLWASLYSIIILTYYFVSIHYASNLYNWIALVTLEGLAVIWWLVSWALMAALLGGAIYFNYGNDNYYYDYYWKTKRDLVKRVTTYNDYASVIDASLAFALIQWILYCVTLVFMILAIVKHRKQTASPAPPASQAAKEEPQMEVQPQQTV